MKTLNDTDAVSLTASKGWHALLFQWSKDVQLWLFITLTLQLFRLILMGVFHGLASSSSGLATYLTVIADGFRFDISTAAIWILPTFLLSIGCGFVRCGRFVQALRRWIGQFYAGLVVIAGGMDIIFFNEYGDQFNQRIFGMITDDTHAILVTIWDSYHPVLFFLVALPIAALFVWAVRRWLAYTPAFILRASHAEHGLGKRVVVSVASLLLFVIAARGGTVMGQPIRMYHAFVVNDMFLNRTTVNPFTSLRYAVETQLELQHSGGLGVFWPSGDMQKAMHLARADLPLKNAKAGKNIDQAFEVTAPGAKHPPRHIFMILMESHSGWTVMPRYRSIGLSPKISNLAKHGIYFRDFLPSGDGTILSLSALLTTYPANGLPLNYEPRTLNGPYPTSMAETFKRMGYKTNFFYGGYLSWQRIDTFAKSQGFDHIYGAGAMPSNGQGDVWGVPDHYLFNFVLKTVKDDTPSFNFILTTSNHPPYDLNLKKLGFPVKKLPADLKPSKAETMKVLGHLWYADREVGRFVHKENKQLPDTLFAMTGDHTARLHIHFPGDNVFEQYAVPFVLYGPSVLKGVKVDTSVAGSHIDIAPTLYDLSAPKGFTYYSFGESLLRKTKPSWGWGYNFFVGDHTVASQSNPPVAYRLPWENKLPAKMPDLTDVRQRFEALKALAWYRVRKGPELH